MKKDTIKYRTDSEIEWTEFKSAWTIGIAIPETIVEDAAEHYFNYCDGWESDWPLTFEIQGLPQKFQVELEACPEFYAEEIHEAVSCNDSKKSQEI